MSDFSTVLATVQKNKARRAYPDRTDSRFRHEGLYPDFQPKFRIAFSKGCSVFTIGSCFARNIEEAIQPLGVYLPTRDFAVPKHEWNAKPNGLLNEYNPATMSRRIVDALDGVQSPNDTLVPESQGYADLLLPGGGCFLGKGD